MLKFGRNLGFTSIFFLVLLLQSCTLDPPHDNPNDPVHTAYQPFGALKLSVLTRTDLEPIVDATVTILRTGEEGRIRITNSEGRVEFPELPEGLWYVIANRDDVSSTAQYGADSLLVDISQTAIVDTFIQLNALPYFIDARANSVTKQDRSDEYTRYVELVARLNDPDGPADIERVEWKVEDLNISGEMRYLQNLDSSYWWSQIPDSAFPNDNFEHILARAVTFTGFDRAGQYTISDKSYVARILNDAIDVTVPPDPYLGEIVDIPWWYSNYSEDFKDLDSSQFHYRLRLFQSVPEVLLYDTLIVPERRSLVSHEISISPLPVGSYYFDVWIIDNFLNYCQSMPHQFDVEPRFPQ